MKNIKPIFETLEKALAEFSQKGYVESVLCECCKKPIRITRKTDTVLAVECDCGQYNDTLRGL